MKLSRLLLGISDIKTENFSDLDVSSVTASSASCKRGALFVAIKGEKHDGCDFIGEAYGRGARVFVLPEKRMLPNDSTMILSNNPRKTLAELCSKISGNPEKKMMFIGITGTKGKTTTTVLLSKILDGMGVKNIAVGTLGVVGMEHPKYVNTTPDPTVLFPLFKEAYRKGVRVVILEVSSQALKDFRIYGIKFDAVGFTGLGKDHVGFSEHPTVSDYIYSKRLLFTSYGAKRAVVNFDDPYSSYMSADIPKVIRCGTTENSDIVISDYSDNANGASFLISGIRVVTKLPGLYNARNTAIALALAREITGNSISEAVGYVNSVKISGRYERYVIDGKNIIIDYAHNKDSVKEVIKLSRRLFGGKIICVFGSVGERSFERRRELAEVAEKYADFSVITSDNPGYEFPLSICADIYSVFKDKNKAKIIADRGNAISYAISLANAGDAVLLLGKGHETVMYISGREILFSDAEFVSQYKKEAK
jgi:UDP-N-acetylmuramoyl-L-alanyl-D-glutamate--2,6-diaminopimelate ligase